MLEHRSPGGDRGLHPLECCGDFRRDQAVAEPLVGHHRPRRPHAALHRANTSPSPRLAYILIYNTPRSTNQGVANFRGWKAAGPMPDAQEAVAQARRAGRGVMRRLPGARLTSPRWVAWAAIRAVSRSGRGSSGDRAVEPQRANGAGKRHRRHSAYIICRNCRPNVARRSHPDRRLQIRIQNMAGAPLSHSSGLSRPLTFLRSPASKICSRRAKRVRAHVLHLRRFRRLDQAPTAPMKAISTRSSRQRGGEHGRPVAAHHDDGPCGDAAGGSPTGLTGMRHADGEILAAAAADFGVPSCNPR